MGIKVREGNGSYGSVTVTLDGKKVRLGDGSYGAIIATIDG